MLQLVFRRSQGLITQRQFFSSVTTKRQNHLELSKAADLVNSYDAAVISMAFDDQEDRYLLCGLGNGVLAVYDLEHPCEDEVTRPVARGRRQYRKKFKPVCTIGRSNKSCHKSSVETVQWYPFDNGIFTTSSTDMTLKIWDANSLKVAETVAFSTAIFSHHMSPVASEHSLIAVGLDASRVKLVDMRTGSQTHALSGHQKAVQLVRWSPNVPFLLATGSRDCRVLLWDIRMARSSIVSLDQHNGDSAACSESVGTAHNGHVLGITFVDDGSHLLTYGADSRLRLWDVFTAKNTLTNYGKIANSSKQNIRLCTSAGTRTPTVYVPCDSAVRTYDVFGGRQVQALTGHLARVTCCAYRTSLQEIYTSSADRNILLWTPDCELENVEEPTNLTLDPELRISSSVRSFTSRTAAVTADRWSSSSGDEG